MALFQLCKWKSWWFPPNNNPWLKISCQNSVFTKPLPQPLPWGSLFTQHRGEANGAMNWGAGESVCVSLNIWFNAAVRSLKLCTPHLALCDHHSYLCNFICNVPSLHSATIMVPQLRQQLQWDKLWLSPQAHFMCWFSTYFHKYFPFENQHPKTKPGFSLLPTKPSHSSLTPHAHREQSVPFWSRVTPGIFDNSYLVPFPVFTWPKTQEVLPTPPMQCEPQAASLL